MFKAEYLREYLLQNFGNGASTLGTFIDIDEDGRLDILMQVKGA